MSMQTLIAASGTKSNCCSSECARYLEGRVDLAGKLISNGGSSGFCKAHRDYEYPCLLSSPNPPSAATPPIRSMDMVG